MGRLTWESLPFKPLPNRRNIVLSKNTLSEIESYNNINSCIKKLKKDDEKSIFVIGGASVYSSFLKIATDLHITLIDKLVDGIDCFFPLAIDELMADYILIKEKILSSKVTYIHLSKK